MTCCWRPHQIEGNCETGSGNAVRPRQLLWLWCYAG